MEASWADFIERNIELTQVWSIGQALSKKDHTLVSDHVTLDIKGLKRCVALDSLGQVLRAVDHELVVLNIEFFQCSRLLEELLEGLAHITPQVVLG